MRSREYWQRNAEEIADYEFREAERVILELDQEYSERIGDIETALLAFFALYAIEGAISFADSRRLLDHKQMQSFKRMVNRFIKESGDKNWLSSLKAIQQRKRISRYDALSVQVRHNVEMIGALQKGQNLLGRVYSDSYYKTVFEVQKGLGLGRSFQKLASKDIQNAISKRWLDGNFSTRLWTDKEKLLREMDTIIQQGFIRGDSVDRMSRELAKRMEVSMHNAARLVRTETAHMAAEATYEAYRVAGVERYQFLATLDNRTSDICRDMDLKVFKLSEKETGINWPPLHPNCRSTTTPYFDENDGVRIARDADGKTYNVPANMTYKQWYKKHVVGKG